MNNCFLRYDGVLLLFSDNTLTLQIDCGQVVHTERKRDLTAMM